MSDSHDLQRFVAAQEAIWPAPLQELAHGRKTTHWMWFVFPQVAGLGRSRTAQFFALPSRAAARAYLAHPVLGARLDAAIDAMLSAPGDAQTMLGPIDALKLRSSMTLFAVVAENAGRFDAVLARFYRWERDPATLELLEGDTR